MSLLSSFVTALTTPFSPAADCFGPTYSITNGSNDTVKTSSIVLGRGKTAPLTTLFHGYTSSCYPEGAFSAVFDMPAGGGHFSPGYCPRGFTTELARGASQTSRAFCCPTSWTLDIAGDIDRSFNCSTLGFATVVDADGTAYLTHAWQFLRGFAVALEPSDEVVLASVTGVSSSASTSNTDSNTASPGATGVSTAASTSTQTLSPDIPRSELSTGAKAGIGVGATLGALLVLVGIVIFFRRRSQAQKPRTEFDYREDGREKLIGLEPIPTSMEVREETHARAEFGDN